MKYNSNNIPVGGSEYETSEVWKKQFKPVKRERYETLTAEQIDELEEMKKRETKITSNRRS